MQQLKRKKCQLHHGKVMILLLALRVDRDDPSLRGIVEARIEHDRTVAILHGAALEHLAAGDVILRG
jgi:hypothetical protein